MLYHNMCSPNGNKEEMIKSLLKNGLESHSTIGRYNHDEEDEYGNCEPLLYEHRIWFQTKQKTGFADLTKPSDKCIVFRTPRDGLKLKDDDQFDDPSGETVFVASDEPFIIEPKNIEYLDGSLWKKLDNKYFKPRKRTKVEELSPWIRMDFEKYRIDMNSDEEVQIYINSECKQTSLYEECLKMKEIFGKISVKCDKFLGSLPKVVK